LLVGGNPAVDGVHLAGRTTVWVLVASLTAALALTAISLAATPIGWLVTGLAALFGLVAPWAWQRRRGIGSNSLAAWHLAPRWVEPVTLAANKAERLRRLAERAPSGPVAEHLGRLANSADGYVIALHETALAADAATGGDPAIDDPELLADMQRINNELADLVDAAERLRDAQRRHLETSPIAELTAETERLTAVLDNDCPHVGDGQ
jgi:hypothetical protein